MDLRLNSGDGERELRAHAQGENQVAVIDGESTTRWTLTPLPDGSWSAVNGTSRSVGRTVRDGDTFWVRMDGRTYRLDLSRGRRSGRSKGPGSLASPMPGQVMKLLVAVGETVEARQPLLVVEAMKMQLEIKAPEAGTVKRFLAVEGEQVEAGVPLVDLDTSS